MKTLKKSDYVLTLNGQPVESATVIYACESVVELVNNGFHLNDGEAFVKITDLTTAQQSEYLSVINQA